MKTSFIYDQGSAPYREDGLFLADPFFGVLDGVSAPYGPKSPARKFNGMSGGEFVARTVEQLFHEGLHSPVLTESVLSVNREVWRLQVMCHCVPYDAGELAGVTFAVAKVNPGSVEAFQTGDCFALWVKRDGEVGITPNQVREHDTEMNAEIERVQREVAGELFNVTLEESTEEQRAVIRGEMWNRFVEVLKDARRQDVNRQLSFRCYGLLNGDPNLKFTSLHVEIPRDELRALLLFSDGMVPWEAMKRMSDREVAECVWEDFQEGGLPHLLRVARGIERRVEAVNYTDSAEATAIALDFSDEK